MYLQMISSGLQCRQAHQPCQPLCQSPVYLVLGGRQQAAELVMQLLSMYWLVLQPTETVTSRYQVRMNHLMCGCRACRGSVQAPA